MAIGVSFAVGILRLAAIVRTHVVDVLSWDQWDFLQPVFDGAPLWDSFRWQHGSHRQGPGGVLLALLYPATGFSNRAEGWAALACFALAALGAVWLITRHARPSVLDAIVPCIVLTTASWETWGATQNLAYGPVPLLLLFAAGCAQEIERPGLRWLVLTAIALLASHAAYGVLLVPILCALLLLELARAWNRPLHVALLLLALAAILGSLELAFSGYAYQQEQTEAVRMLGQPFDVLSYAALVVARPWGISGRIGAARLPLALLTLAVVTALFLIAALRVWRSRGDDPASRALFVFCGVTLAFAATTALGRSSLGLDLASSSRYVPFALPSAVGIWLFVRMLPATRLRAAVLACLCAVLAGKEVLSAPSQERALAVFSERKRAFVACFRARRDLNLCNADRAIHPAPESSHVAAKLRWLEEHRASFFRE